MEGLTLFVAVSRAGEPCFTLEITRVPFTLGASPRCDVVLDDPFVSRKHAVVTLTRGQLHFADTSSNGSFYADQRIVNQLLQNGDTIEIHPFEVRFDYTLDDDEERHTALRSLDELISPEIRERMRAAAPPPSRQPSPSLTAPERDEPGVAPDAPEGDLEPEAAPPPAGTESQPEPPVDRPPLGEPPAEDTEGDTPATDVGEGALDAVTAQAPVQEPAPMPPAAAEEPVVPQVTLVPAGPGGLPTPEQTPDVEKTQVPPPAPAEAETSEESTAIVPPPPPVPPRRPPVSRAEDSPPLPRPAAEPPAFYQAEEPPTIAFATIRPEAAAKDETGSENEGTIHMTVERLVSCPRFSLEVVDGPPDLVGRTYPLPDREVTVGRGDQADFRLECDNISRLHASLSPQGPGEWLLRDLASLNGTYVATQRITQVSLRLGGELRLANAITLTVVETSEAQTG